MKMHSEYAIAEYAITEYASTCNHMYKWIMIYRKDNKLCEVKMGAKINLWHMHYFCYELWSLDCGEFNRIRMNMKMKS